MGPSSSEPGQISGEAHSSAVRCHCPIQEVEHPEQSASRWALMTGCLSFIVIQCHSLKAQKIQHFHNLPSWLKKKQDAIR